MSIALTLVILAAACSGNGESKRNATTSAKRGDGTTAPQAVEPEWSTTSPATTPAGQEVRPPVEQPNIVVIMTDDQTVDQLASMPRTKRLLVDQGTTFSNSIVTYPLCCPSRATFFTGQYSHNNGVQWNSGANGGYGSFKGQDTAIPATMQSAGYRTAHIGKFLNGYGDKKRAEIPKGWDEWHGLVGPSTGQYFGFTLNHNGVLDTYGADDYQTDVLTDLAVDEIDAASKSQRPFFLSLAYLAPHAAFGCPLAECSGADIREDREYSNTGFALSNPVPAPRHAAMFSDAALPEDPSYNLALDGEEDLRPELSERDGEDITKNYRAELASLQAVDEGVERVVTALEAAGHLDDTLIVFTSDNGYFHGQRRLKFGKYLPYEPSLTVPLVVRGPGVAVNAVNRSVVANVDLGATMVALAGVEPLRTLDGRSLVDVLSNPALVWDRPVLIEGLGPQTASQPQYFGIRTGRFAYFEFASGANGGVELYDIIDDPHQLTNLAVDPDAKTAAAIAQLATLVGDLRACAGVVCSDAVVPAELN